ncbi:MAG: hypothetical protein FWG40_11660 [Peptococcaceae bacterium]|nr:hypothetical protein [Peptococcaceae bacterium]
MNTAAKVIVVFVVLYLAFWIFRNYITGILGVCFWLIRGMVFLALILVLLHYLLRIFFGINLMNIIRELWR